MVYPTAVLPSEVRANRATRHVKSRWIASIPSELFWQTPTNRLALVWDVIALDTTRMKYCEYVRLGGSPGAYRS